MKKIIWSDVLCVGVDEIDEDHQRLTDIYNLFVQAVNDKKPPDYQEALLEELIRFALWHFKHEERLMLKHNYPGFDEHKDDHLYLEGVIDALRHTFIGPQAAATQQEVEHLERWIFEHILASDMAMAKHITETK